MARFLARMLKMRKRKTCSKYMFFLAKFWPAGSYVTFVGSLNCNDSASFNRIWHHQHLGQVEMGS